MENLSPSDVALLGRNGDGWGGNSFFWIFALLILAGVGGFGWGNRGDYGQYATAASQQEILFGQRFASIDDKIDKIGYGICDSTYALNNSITTEGRNLQSQVANNKYDLASAIHAEGEATRNMLQQNKIESLQGQINQLQMQNAMCGVVRYPMQTTYTSGTNPFCGCNCNNGF